jgi:hypothetical protein
MVKGHSIRWSGLVFNRKTLSSITDGTLRVGRLLIEYLDADLYIGMDIDMRILGFGRAALPPALLETKRPTLELISRETLAEVAARRPKWVFSKGVLQHVPPRNLDEYFKNLSCLIHSGATGWIKSRIGLVPKAPPRRGYSLTGQHRRKAWHEVGEMVKTRSIDWWHRHCHDEFLLRWKECNSSYSRLFASRKLPEDLINGLCARLSAAVKNAPVPGRAAACDAVIGCDTSWRAEPLWAPDSKGP